MALARDWSSPARTEPGAILQGDEITMLTAAHAATCTREAVLGAIERIAVASMDGRA